MFENIPGDARRAGGSAPSTLTSNTHLSPFVMTGILGGFTTFSAFSLEAYTLFERGQTAAAATYVGASVVLSIAGLVAGIIIARGIWA